MTRPNKLERLLLESPFGLVQYFQVRHLLGVPFKGRLRVLLADVRPGWKGFPGSNVLAYLASL
jgi:hypothetical protein